METWISKSLLKGDSDSLQFGVRDPVLFNSVSEFAPKSAIEAVSEYASTYTMLRHRRS